MLFLAPAAFEEVCVPLRRGWLVSMLFLAPAVFLGGLRTPPALRSQVHQSSARPWKWRARPAEVDERVVPRDLMKAREWRGRE
jgi:hypothetical protein